MNGSEYCFFNGEMLRYDELCLHVSDLLFQRGYGVFDFFRTRNGELTWLDDYLDRFFNSLELAGIDPGVSRRELTEQIRTLKSKNSLDNGAFKLIATGGYSDNLESVTGPANLLVLNRPWKRPPAETREKGVSLVTDRFVRPNPEIKSLYYLNSLRLRERMEAHRAVDVLYHTDLISETSRANLFFVRGDRISTPTTHILKGITRKHVLKLFQVIHVEDIAFQRLHEFDEIFMTSTSRDVTPVCEIDGRKVGKGVPGEFTREIMAAFAEQGW
ncbi:MAG: aminotransferase class IV [Bacteroidota bacterium]